MGGGGRKIVVLLFDSKSNAIGPRSIRGLYAALERFCDFTCTCKNRFFRDSGDTRPPIQMRFLALERARLGASDTVEISYSVGTKISR